MDKKAQLHIYRTWVEKILIGVVLLVIGWCTEDRLRRMFHGVF